MLLCFGKSRAERQEIVQWTILVNEPAGALGYYSFFKKFMPKCFFCKVNGTL